MNNEKHKLKNLKLQMINKEETRKPKVKNFKEIMEMKKGGKKMKKAQIRRKIRFYFIKSEKKIKQVKKKEKK